MAAESDLMATGMNPRFALTAAPPVGEARKWLETVELQTEQPVLNLSQAAPIEPPPAELRDAISRFALADPAAHAYGPVLGSPALRSEIAEQWSKRYGGQLGSGQVGITSGCNQAFAVTASVIAGPDDAILMAAPYYFNHKMWLDMMGIETRFIEVDSCMLPSPEHAAAQLSPRVKAIALVSPNNPTGAIYPPELLLAFYELAQAHGLYLILDETYRDFIPTGRAPHELFSDPDWPQTLVHLYSFSKAYRLTGHRVGAIAASEQLLGEAEKFLDTVSICPNQIAQHAALYGLQHLDSWLSGEKQEMLERIQTVRSAFDNLPGWRLLSSGAYFAYVRHPFTSSSEQLVLRLLQKKALLLLPGTMFADSGRRCGSGTPEQQFRLAIANVEPQRIIDAVQRLDCSELATEG